MMVKRSSLLSLIQGNKTVKKLLLDHIEGQHQINFLQEDNL